MAPFTTRCIRAARTRRLAIRIRCSRPGFSNSLAAINLILILERDFGVDFASLGFDAAMIDTIADMAALADSGREMRPA